MFNSFLGTSMYSVYISDNYFGAPKIFFFILRNVVKTGNAFRKMANKLFLVIKH